MNAERKQELLLWALLALISAVPLRDGLIYDAVVGAGPDVVSTLWGMWWFQQEGLLLGGDSQLLNYPYGGVGNVLSPSSAVLWALLEPLMGIGRAAAVAAWLQVFGLCAGLGLLCRILVEERWAYWLAAFSPLIGRYLFFGIGEGSLVAIAALPLPLGLWGLFYAQQQSSWLGVFCASFCMLWMGMENPYLAPVLPSVAVYLLLFRRGSRSMMFAAFLLGTIGILWVAAVFGKGANPEYPREIAGQSVVFFNRSWEVVDLPWARLSLTETFWPEPLRWTTAADSATSAGGGRYLSIVLLFTSFSALLVPRARVWFCFGAVGWALSLGSLNSGFAGPFLFLNGLMDELARPLTQPTRFLIVVVVAQGVLLALLVDELKRSAFPLPRWLPILSCCLVVDALTVGGLRLHPPNTELPAYTCTTKLNGGTLVWPWDAVDGEKGRSQLYQMLHDAPAPHTGIASWALSDEGRAEPRLRSAGFRSGSSRLQLQMLAKLGYSWLIVEKGSGFPLSGLEASEECGSADLYDLSAWRGPSRAVEGRR